MFDVGIGGGGRRGSRRGLLWIRGHVVMNPGLCRDINQRAIEQAMRAFALVLQAGNFGLVVFDAAEAPGRCRSGDCRSRRGCGCSGWSEGIADRVPAGRQRADGAKRGGADIKNGDWGLGIGD